MRSAKTLRVSFVGMQTQEVAIKPNLRVVLKSDAEVLDEVVVTAMGIKRSEKALGYSATSVNSERITETRTSDIMSSLSGKIAGVQISNTSSDPGASNSVIIRGVSSLSGSNQPLYVVDGVPLSAGGIETINPRDIESIDILKDASSTAIYGTRGANGIIMITTKKGKEGKSKVSFNAFVSSTMITDYPDIMDAEEYAQYKREAYRDRTTGKYAEDAAVFAPEELTYLEKGYDTNYRDMLMHNGFNQNYEVSVSGGNTKTKHNISLGYRSEEGLFKDDNYKRYNARVALDHQLFDNVQVGTNIIYAYVDKNNRYSPLNMANKIVPISKDRKSVV